MPAIKKPFNSKELRKKEAQLRARYNRAIKAIEDLDIPITTKVVKQLEDSFHSDFTELVKSHAEEPKGDPTVEESVVNFEN